jgi:hypothetical protein
MKDEVQCEAWVLLDEIKISAHIMMLLANEHVFHAQVTTSAGEVSVRHSSRLSIVYSLSMTIRECR